MLGARNIDQNQPYQEFATQKGQITKNTPDSLGTTPTITETQTKHENTKEKGKNAISLLKENSQEMKYYISFFQFY